MHRVLLFFSVVVFALSVLAQEEGSASQDTINAPKIIAPGSTWDLLNTAGSKQSKNKYDDAIKDLEKAISINPDFYQAYMARGGIKFLKYDFPGALTDYDSAIFIIEKLVKTFATKSEIKNVLGDAEGAVGEIDQANKMRPAHAETYYRRGSVKRFLSDKEGSCKDINKSMELGFLKAENSMKNYCGYIPPEPGGAKGKGSPAPAKSAKPKETTAPPAATTPPVKK